MPIINVPVNQTQLEELDRSFPLVTYPESSLTSRLRGNDGVFAFIVFPAQAGIQDI